MLYVLIIIYQHSLFLRTKSHILTLHFTNGTLPDYLSRFVIAESNDTEILHFKDIHDSLPITSLRWRYNERDGVSNHQRLDGFLNRLFRCRTKKNIKAPRHWPLWGEFTGDRWIPLTKAENVSISCSRKLWWVHSVLMKNFKILPSGKLIQQFQYILLFSEFYVHSLFIFQNKILQMGVKTV